MEIGAIIKKARCEASLTQEQAAEALGVSRQTVSNWENCKSYPDIISVIKMSDLYSVSLDCLLKEETSMKQTYKEYLEESTNTVKSKERQSLLMLILVTLGIWALSVLTFWLVKSRVDSTGYSLTIMWTVLPITFFVVSFMIGFQNYFGKYKWLTALVFSLMYTLSGYTTSIVVDDMLYQSVIWPDFTKLPIGLVISLAGLGLGVFVKKTKGNGVRTIQL